MYTPGTMLRLAREERRLSVSDVKYCVRIRESAIVAMENDDFERFPAEYMHVFLPAYADFLGVSHYKLAESFKMTLPEYEHLTRSLYAQTLQQIAMTQLEEEYRELHPALTARLGKFAVHHAFQAIIVLCVCVFGWSAMSSGVKVFGTFFESRFVVTPEEMRGTPFAELTDVLGQPQFDGAASGANRKSTSEFSMPHRASMQIAEQVSEEQQMKTVHLASLFAVDVAAVQTLAVKHSAALSYAVGDALVHAVEDLTPHDPHNTAYDASRRSVSSIAASLTRASEEQNMAEQQEISTISEVSIEQNRLPVASPQTTGLVHPEHKTSHFKRAAKVWVQGVEAVALRDVIAARKRVGMRIAALRVAMLMTRRVPIIETVELKARSFAADADMSHLKIEHSALSGSTQHEKVQSVVIPPDIAREMLKSVVMPKLPSAWSVEQLDLVSE